MQSYQRFQHIVHTVFNTSGTNAPRSLSCVKTGTHSAFGEGSHTRAHTPKQGCFGRGWYHYPRSVPHVHKHPRAGYQNGVLCRFWVLVGGALKERRKPRDSDALMRVAVPRHRGPAGLRDLFSFLPKLRLVRPVPDTSFGSPDVPACAIPVQAASRLVPCRLGTVQGFSVLPLRLTSFFDFGDKKRPPTLCAHDTGQRSDFQYSGC